MHEVEVEVLLLSERSGAVHSRITRLPVPAFVDPDDVARESVDAPQLVHSTSWRRDDHGRLVLTYVVVPDPAPEAAVRLDTSLVLSSGDPIRPTPARQHDHHVVAHAVRHLASLMRSDPAIGAAVPHDSPLGAAVAATAAGLRTGPHDLDAERSA